MILAIIAFKSLDSLRKNGLDWVKDLGKKNLEDMMQLIQWNEDNVRWSSILSLFHVLSHGRKPITHGMFIFTAYQVFAPFIQRVPLRFTWYVWLPPQR
jgi:hypothetical protein